MNPYSKISEQFPGPRQVGKTTLLEHCKEKDREYITLDDLDERALDAMVFT